MTITNFIHEARKALERSEQLGSEAQELRELRAAVALLADALTELARHRD